MQRQQRRNDNNNAGNAPQQQQQHGNRRRNRRNRGGRGPANEVHVEDQGQQRNAAPAPYEPQELARIIAGFLAAPGAPAPAAVPAVPAHVDENPIVNLPNRVMAIEAARRYKPKVHPESSAAKALTSLGFGFLVGKDLDSNPHATGAALRSIATARIMGLALEENMDRPYRMVSMFSSPRDAGIAQFLKTQTQTNNFTLDLYRPIITAKDNLRHRAVASINDITPDHETFLFVDVYDGFNLDSLFELIINHDFNAIRNKRHVFLWVGRCFMSDFGRCEDEATWYRGSDGQIHFYPDETTTENYTHDPCDWIWTKSTESRLVRDHEELTLTWAEYGSVGSFKMMSFSFSIANVVPSPPMAYTPQFLDLEVPSTTAHHDFFRQPGSWFQHKLATSVPSLFIHLLPKRVVRFPKNIALTLVDKFCVEKKRSYTLNRICADASSLIEKDPVWSKVVRVNPAWRIDLHDLAWAIFNYRIEERTELAQAVHDTLGTTQAAFNLNHGLAVGEASQPAGVRYKPLIQTAVAIAGCGAVLMALRPSIAKTAVKVMWRVGQSAIWNTLAAKLFTGSAFTAMTIKRAAFTSHNTIAVEYDRGFLRDVIITPVLEEAVKRIFKPSDPKRIWLDRMHHALPLFEWACYGFQPFYLPTYLMHEVAYRQNFWAGVAIHACWNLAVHTGMFQFAPIVPNAEYQLPPSPGPYEDAFVAGSQFSRFISDNYLEPWGSRAIDTDPGIFVERFAPALCSLPRSMETYADKPPVCKDLVLSGTPLFQTERNPTYFYSILPTNVPGYVPAITDKNLMDAVEYRILAAPPLDPKIQETNWDSAMASFKHLLPLANFQQIVWAEEVDEWLEHFPSAKKTKYKRLLNDYQEKSSHSDYLRGADRTDVFMKSNEMLFRQKNGVYGLKPRVIINVSPKIQLLVGPQIYRAQQNLKETWPLDPEYHLVTMAGKEVLISFSYAGASTDASLTIWMERALTRAAYPKISIIVCGDDSLVIHDLDGDWVAYEGDASMFDQSQSFGPHKAARWFYLKLGIDQDVLDILKKLTENTYYARSRKGYDVYRINKAKRALRDTGGADTSLGNSLIMAVAWFFVLLRTPVWAKDEFIKSFLFLGFDMKLRVNDPTTSSFLKGMWYHTDHGMVWGPLPSRILKMGKSLTDPRILYRNKNLEVAAKRFLSDVAASYRCFLQVPFVKEFVETFYDAVQPVLYVPPGRTQVQHTDLCRYVLLPEAMDQICARYDCDPELLHKTLALFPKTPFNFCSSPIYLKMVAADYW